MYKTKASANDIKYILDNLRAEDREELEAAHGKSWNPIVFEKIIDCEDVNIGISEKTKNPVLMWGVVPEELPARCLCSDFFDGRKKEYIGCIWLLSTNEIEQNYICFLKNAKKQMQIYEKEYKILCNQVHKANKGAINWLKWLGLKFKPYTEDFMFFYKEKGENNV